MAEKQLKVSMIFGGSFHKFGTVLDEEKIPPNLRKTKYLTEPEEEKEEIDNELELEEGFEEEEERFEEQPKPKPKRKLR